MPKFTFPNPNDRTFNDPMVLIDAYKVLGIYNQNCSEKQTGVTEQVQKWFIEKALHDYHWSEACFLGHQCLLTMKRE